ncbi:hypothetical protein JTE90_027623 [Oedothorax gibbosus]|uniref:Uncharacterized protein n=1 Tax=Oedothorax gibbosus TaxID=931172 RepID=A0AAV6VJF2_9ARAC|nr:hypothetical protein JTE90_027623 [Oedothorax gibbosus]
MPFSKFSSGQGSLELSEVDCDIKAHVGIEHSPKTSVKVWDSPKSTMMSIDMYRTKHFNCSQRTPEAR